jgi:hypothetical protein
MRHRRSSVWNWLVACSLVALAITAPLHAQSGNVVEGALEFLIPTGARMLGLGQAGTAGAIGTEALWLNPSLMARAHRELALHAVSGVIIPEGDVTLAAIYPVPRVLTVGIYLRYMNYGQQEATLDPRGQSGTFVTSSTTIGTSFAAPLTNRLAVGLTLKVLRIGFGGTGEIPNRPQNSPLTGAVDVGGEYIITKDSVFILGGSILNVGLPLQFNDSPQADPLPKRLAIGLQYAPKLAQYPTVRGRLMVDAVSRLVGGGSPGYRFGGEVSWLDRYHGRAGYVISGPSASSGATLGVGASFARWRVDFSQFLSAIASEFNSKPTYLSFRYVF